MTINPTAKDIADWEAKGLVPPGTAAKPGQKYGAAGFWDTEGEYWHSKREHARWLELNAMEKAGLIRDLKRGKHCRFKLEVNGVLIGHYTPDFLHTDAKTGQLTVEDVKGVLTREYRRTKRLMKAIHGIDITEVK